MDDLEILEVEGTSEEGERITFSYFGITPGLKYIQPFVQNKLITENSLVIKRSTMPLSELENTYAACKSDLIIVAVDKETVSALATPEAFIMPFRIHQIVNTFSGWDVVKKSMSKREVKRSIKQKEQYNLDYHVTYKDEDFFYFYDTIHKPTMDVRFGELARSVERNEAFTQLFKKGLLFVVTYNDIPISGSVSQIDKEKNWLNARLIGVLEGDSKYREMGGQNHVYHSILHWACNEGKIDVVDFQGCEPFLTKGTFQYKKRFGTSAILPPNDFYNKRLLVKANFNLKAIRDFFINNPVMLINEKDELGAGYFYDIDIQPRLDIPYVCPGFEYHKLINVNNICEEQLVCI